MVRNLLALFASVPFVAEAKTVTEALIFNELITPTALQKAKNYADKFESGFVVSLAQLMHARVNAPYENVIWNNWFTTTTEEYAFTTPDGQKVVIVVHGGAVFLDASRMMKAGYGEDGGGITHDGHTPDPGYENADESAGLCTKKEVNDLLKGVMPDGSKIPIYEYDDFVKGIPNMPQRYGVVIDAEVAKKSPNTYAPVESLYNDPLFVARLGGKKLAAAYLDKALARHNTTKYGTWHPYARVNFSEPQGRLVYLAGNEGGVGSDGSSNYTGYAEAYGIGGDANIVGRGRYITVTKVDESTSMGDLKYRADGKNTYARRVWAPEMASALQEAQSIAGPDGFVASMPEIVHARTQAAFDNDVWNYELSTTSDESIVNSSSGLKVVTVHGGGIFATSERIRLSYAMDARYYHMTGDFTARLSEKEAADLLEGLLPDGSRIPMYTHEEFKKGVASLPRRYGVITPFDIAKTAKEGEWKVADLRDDPMVIVRCGGVKQAAAYMDKIGERWNDGSQYNRFSYLWKANVPSVSPLFIDTIDGDGGGLAASYGVMNKGNYIAVAPEDKKTTLRFVDFEVPYSRASLEFVV